MSAMKKIVSLFCLSLLAAACNSGSSTSVGDVGITPTVAPVVNTINSHSEFQTEVFAQVDKATNKPKAAPKAPWDSLSAEEKKIFVEDLSCAEATAAAKGILSWTAGESEATALFEKDGYTQTVVTAPDNETQAMVIRGPGKDATTPLLIAIPPVLLMVDYNMAYQVFVKQVEPADALPAGTGEYFCQIPL